MNFDLYTDSSANIPDETIAARQIHIITYTCTVGDKQVECYREGVSSREVAKRHYALMRAGTDVRTSLLNKDTIVKALLPSLEAGRDVFFATISSGISGTYQQALAAKKELGERFPERKIVIVDSANASMGEGLLVLRVADLRDMGESIETSEEWFLRNRYKVNSVVTVGDLKYLRKGGRISAAVAFAGTLLNIKPLLRATGEKNARLVLSGKERGRKRAVAALLEAFDKLAVQPESQTVSITHGDCEEEANALADALRERGVREVIVEYYDICTGTHVGPDTIALFFWGVDRRGEEKTQKAPADRRAPVKVKN